MLNDIGYLFIWSMTSINNVDKIAFSFPSQLEVFLKLSGRLATKLL